MENFSIFSICSYKIISYLTEPLDKVYLTSEDIQFLIEIGFFMNKY